MLLMAMPLASRLPNASHPGAVPSRKRAGTIIFYIWEVRIYSCALMPAAMRSNSSGSNCRCGLVKRMSASLCMGTR